MPSSGDGAARGGSDGPRGGRRAAFDALDVAARNERVLPREGGGARARGGRLGTLGGGGAGARGRSREPLGGGGEGGTARSGAATRHRDDARTAASKTRSRAAPGPGPCSPCRLLCGHHALAKRRLASFRPPPTGRLRQRNQTRGAVHKGRGRRAKVEAEGVHKMCRRCCEAGLVPAQVTGVRWVGLERAGRDEEEEEVARREGGWKGTRGERTSCGWERAVRGGHDSWGEKDGAWEASRVEERAGHGDGGCGKKRKRKQGGGRGEVAHGSVSRFPKRGPRR